MNFKNRKITYGKVEISEEEFSTRNVKERITTFVDQDVLDHFRERARQIGTKYQALINQALREAMSKPTLEERVENLEKKFKKLA